MQTKTISRQRLHSFFVLVTLLSVLSNCSDSNSGDSASTDSGIKDARNLLANDFVGIPSGLSAQEFQQKLNKSTPFKLFEAAFDLNADQLACFEQKTGNYTFEEDGAGFYKIYLPPTNMKQCFDSDSVAYEYYFYSFYARSLQLADTSGNMLKLTGLSIAQLPMQAFLHGYTRTVHELVQLVNTNDAGVVPVRASYYQSVHSENAWEIACETTTVFTGCVHETFRRASSAFDSRFDGIDYRKLTANNLGIAGLTSGATYFNDGSIDFQLNNWIGVMTYANDPNLAPTYTASDGSDQVSGTYGM